MDSRLYVFSTIIINDSDIGFNFEFTRIVLELQKYDFFKKIKMLIIGTCGGYHGKKYNSAYYIKGARKVDRGIIDSNNNLKLDDTRNLFVDTKKCHFFEDSVISSNFLFNNDVFLKNYSCGLVDMETYDFMKICEIYKIECYGGIRVVSDILNKDDDILTRVSVSFNDVIIKFYNFLITGDIIYREVYCGNHLERVNTINGMYENLINELKLKNNCQTLENYTTIKYLGGVESFLIEKLKKIDIVIGDDNYYNMNPNTDNLMELLLKYGSKIRKLGKYF